MSAGKPVQLQPGERRPAPPGVARGRPASLAGALARLIAWNFHARAGCRLQALRMTFREKRNAGDWQRLMAAAAAPEPEPRRLFRDVPDDLWYWLIRGAGLNRRELAGILPAVPDPAVQIRCSGEAGELALWQAFALYRLFRRLADKHGVPLSGCRSVLEFGCGWGRIIRYFLKDVEPGGLWGVDVNPDFIGICRAHDRWSRFKVVQPSGPLDFPDGSFDLVYSYSVFSHFSEAMQAAWLAEIRRVLRPGGLFIASTRPREFILQCVIDRMRRPFSRHPQALSGRFPATREWLARFDDGQYCFEPYPGQTDWGDACIPKAYVDRRWTEPFDVLEYIADLSQCPQAVIVARRRAEPPAPGQPR